MDDMISRQAAIDEIKEIYEWHDNVTKERIIEHFKQLPSAERTGRWTYVYDENAKLFFKNQWVCSACGMSNAYGMSDFCPHCGAMMENSTRRTMEAENKSV